jgi:hypothetical protein
MPNVLIKEATIVITPSNQAVHAKIGEVFELNKEDADSLIGANRGVYTKEAPYRIPDKPEKDESAKETSKK